LLYALMMRQGAAIGRCDSETREVLPDW